MTAIYTTAIKATVLAAVFAAGISGAAMAGGTSQVQTGGNTPPSNVTAGSNGSTSPNIGTWATVRALQVYQKCKDNILPECPSN